MARKEEELQNPKELFSDKQNGEAVVQYVWERIESLQPKKKKTLQNSIGAIFQFQGAISDADRERIISELQKLKHIQIDGNNRVSYL